MKEQVYTQEELLENLSGIKFRKLGIMSRFIPKNEAHIVSKFKELSADDQKRLMNKQLKTLDGTIVVAANIKGASGIFEMINGTDKGVGVCSLDKGKVPSGENYSIDKIYFFIGVDTNETDPRKIKYNDFWTNSDFAPLQNALISFWSDNKLLSEFDTAVVLPENGMNNRASVITLDKPIFLKSEERFEIKIEFPKGVSMPTNRNYFFKVLLKGIKTIKRN